MADVLNQCAKGGARAGVSWRRTARVLTVAVGGLLTHDQRSLEGDGNVDEAWALEGQRVLERFAELLGTGAEADRSKRLGVFDEVGID